MSTIGYQSEHGDVVTYTDNNLDYTLSLHVKTQKSALDKVLTPQVLASVGAVFLALSFVPGLSEAVVA